jgi:hypothetical protein
LPRNSDGEGSAAPGAADCIARARSTPKRREDTTEEESSPAQLCDHEYLRSPPMRGRWRAESWSSPYADEEPVTDTEPFED